MNIKSILKKHIIQSLTNNGIKKSSDILVYNTYDKKPWNYQINGIINIAKHTNQDSYTLAKKIAIKMQIHEMYKSIQVSQPGFINIFLNETWMFKKLEKKINSIRLDVKLQKPKNIVIDYSSPNIAKDMHVGHLRSTVIGDATARIMEFLGHNVIRMNHIGDWGMQFGMIIAYLQENKKKLELLKFLNFNAIYQKAKKLCEKNEKFLKKTQECTIKLQSDDKCYKKIWQEIVNITIHRNEKIYKKLDVTLSKKHILGESFYKDMLPEIVKDLKNKRIAIEHNGAIIVFLNTFKNRNGDPMGVTIKNEDGRFLYAATDLACLKYRYEVLHADQILYYTDSRQHRHLMQIIEIGKKAGYIPNDFQIEHHMFGMILSKNNRPFKTRSGENIKLSFLLNEAINRAKTIAKQKNPAISNKKLNLLAKKIGIGAIKYFDLSKNRSTNYTFNWKNILSFNGNTAPYIQYAYTRILSIFKKLEISMIKIKGKIQLTELCEIKLGFKLLQFEEIIVETSKKGMPHILCGYLYDLATLFSHFYENCSILFSKNIKTHNSRLILSFLTARTIKQGLKIIGISTINYM
ncbi:arginyl-tRNA synthetase [Buchnera aphidicola (Schlechtendalia chinensis)]|uniref:Arginine--tRNA ligase n=2 Tax=Buchnera aphidicola TaxID=9 RepID=A0A172WDK2_BUCSC|nr:arginine--tRNA ligase [Buchnera aphidicola]ANF17017.1 arginyl-tRNA synthetase [Buchnera aphidicola (Schlechtendalia chinensis)]